MKCTNFSIGWHVLCVKTQWEKKVDVSLKNISVESYLPVMKTVRQWSDRKKTISKPLFPSYLFVKINSSLEFQKALTVDGVYTYLKFGREYAQVTEKEINQIKFLVDSRHVSELAVNAHLPKVGDIKKIIYGPFSGMDCEVVRIGNDNKVIVQMELLNNNITATIPSYYFEGSRPSKNI